MPPSTPVAFFWWIPPAHSGVPRVDNLGLVFLAQPMGETSLGNTNRRSVFGQISFKEISFKQISFTQISFTQMSF
jgi:hypothetical protein